MILHRFRLVPLMLALATAGGARGPAPELRASLEPAVSLTYGAPREPAPALGPAPMLEPETARSQTTVVAPSSDNVAVLAVLPPPAGGSSGDVWADRDLVVIADRAAGWSLIDVTLPQAPRRTAARRGELFTQDVKVEGDLVVVSNEEPAVGAGAILYRVADRTAPVELARITAPVGRSVHNVFVTGGFLYLSSNNTGRIEIFDVRVPSAPVHVASVADPNGSIHDAVVVGGRLYGSFLRGGFTVHDVRDPANPVQLASHDYPGAFTHNAWPSPDGRFLYTTDEVQNGHMRVWDLGAAGGGSGPVRQVGRYAAAQDAIIHNVHAAGALVYAAYYTAGLRIVDVSNPRLPVEVAFVDTFPGSGQAFDGAWGVHPFNEGGLVYVSDISTGLWVVRFDGRVAASPQGFEARGVLVRTALFARTVADLRWSAHPEAVGYNVYRAEPGGAFARLNVEPHPDTRFLDAVPGAGSHEYAVSAVLPDGTESRATPIRLVEPGR